MVLIRTARKSDLLNVVNLINCGVKEGSILKRTKSELILLIKKELVFVAEDDLQLVGIVILDFY